MFTNALLQSEESIDVQYKRWKRILNKAIHACFRKIRLTEKKKDDMIEQLMKEKRIY